MILEELEEAMQRVLATRILRRLIEALAARGYEIVAMQSPPPGWTRAGCCHHQLHTIFLYGDFMPGGDDVRDDNVEFVLRHEIAHALGFEHGSKMDELDLSCWPNTKGV